MFLNLQMMTASQPPVALAPVSIYDYNLALMNIRKTIFFLLAILLLMAGCSSQPDSSDLESLPTLTTIQNKGSDTIVNLALAWAL